MSFQHVEDTEPVSKEFEGASIPDPYMGGSYRRRSGTTIALSTWRCSECRALAVTAKGLRPTGKCGKCGAPA